SCNGVRCRAQSISRRSKSIVDKLLIRARCQLSGVKRTFGSAAAMSANDPKRTSRLGRFYLYPYTQKATADRVLFVSCGALFFHLIEGRRAHGIPITAQRKYPLVAALGLALGALQLSSPAPAQAQQQPAHQPVN